VKNAAEFKTFLDDEVNLNQHRIDTLTQRVDAVSSFLSSSDWHRKYCGLAPKDHGLHQTIIKPLAESTALDVRFKQNRLRFASATRRHVLDQSRFSPDLRRASEG